MMNMKKMLALLLAVVMVLGMIPFGAMAEEAETVTHIETCLENCALEDCACECHAEPETPAEPKQEENPVTPLSLDDTTTEETPVVDATKTEETPVCTCTPVEGVHAAECALSAKTEEPPVVDDTKTEETPVCTCTPVEGVHAAECALSAKTEETPVVDDTKTEETPVCTCTPVEGVHVEGCALYEEPEETTTEPTVIVDFEELYARFMVCVSVSEVDAIYADMTEEEAVAFLDALSEEQRSALLNHFAELGEAEAEVGFDPVTPAVNFTNAASFGAPVKGQAARSTFSLKRTMAMAAAVDDENDNGLEVRKTVSAPDANGKYTLTLEAWTTGEKTITSVSSTKPTDIILVLDQSGSMNYCMYANCSNQQCNGNHGNSGVTYTAVYDIQENGTYYRIRNGQYRRVYYCDGYDSNYDSYDCEAGWYTEEHGNSYYQHGGTQLTPKTSANSSGTQFYVQNTSSNQTYPKRLAALKDAVTQFVAAVNTKAAGPDEDISTTDDNIDHRIAIVGFASEDSYGYNTEVLTVSGNNSGTVGVRYKNLTNTHYGSALQDVSTVPGQSMVTNAINALSAQGATEVDLGIEMANRIFEQNPIPAGEERNRVVIVFTDGTPTTFDTYDSTVADSAISNAYTSKNTYSATVYSIGIFGGADGTNPGTLPANNSTGSNRENRFMHLVSSNYKNATRMTSTGSVNPDLASGESYYLSASDSNALNDIFETISKNIESGGTTTKLDESTIVKDIIADSFKLPDGADQNSIKVYTDGVNSTTGEFNNSRTEYAATVSISGKDISVTNFDFSENWVGSETVDGTKTYRGKKLIIEIPIVPNPDFLGGNNVPTNGSASGVYSEGEMIEAFPEPDVDVSIKILEIGLATIDQNIYLTNDADLAALVTALDHRINGSNNAYVDIKYEIKDGETVIGTVTIPAGGTLPTTITWTEAEGQDMTPNLDAVDTKNYTIVATASPISDGTYDATTNEKIEPVNVFKPVITWQDSEINAGETPDYEGTNPDVEDNFVSAVWKHGATLSTAVTMRGTEPTLDYTYSPAATKMNEDTPVDVTVKVGDTDITANVTFIHKFCDFENCGWTEADEGIPGAEFIVHIKSFDLIIKKDVVDGDAIDQSFLFKITCPDKTTMTIVINGEGQVKIADLPTGNYTVEEDTSWSWRYDVVGEASRTVTPANISNGVATVTFENDRTNDKWLDGSSYAKNSFTNQIPTVTN